MIRRKVDEWTDLRFSGWLEMRGLRDQGSKLIAMTLSLVPSSRCPSDGEPRSKGDQRGSLDTQGA